MRNNVSPNSPSLRGSDTSSLFDATGDSGSLFENLKARRDKYGDDVCARVDALWAAYASCADPDFVSEFRSCLPQRYWEMYLTCTLWERGLEVDCPKPGPDLLAHGESDRVWIEAVAPTAGESGSPDEVPEPPWSGVYDYPCDQIVLRYRNAIDNKHVAYAKYLSTGIVGQNDPYVIAVSGSGTRAPFEGTTAPDILKAVLPVGHQQMHIGLDTGDYLGSDFALRPEVPKASGSMVSTTLFLEPGYAGISAVLFSNTDVLNPPQVAGSEFILVHNPLATNPVPQGWLGFGREYSPELLGDVLKAPCTTYEGSTSG